MCRTPLLPLYARELGADARSWTPRSPFFNWLPERNWLRKIELQGSLDYVATGLPKAGDEGPRGERFLDDASRWSLSLVFVIPVAPL